MPPAAQSPRTARSFQPDPVKSLAVLLVLGVLSLALATPKAASAQGSLDALRDHSTLMAPALPDSSACDGHSRSALASSGPSVVTGWRIVRLGSAPTAARHTLDPSVFLVRVSTDGNEMSALCDGIRLNAVAEAHQAEVIAVSTAATQQASAD